MASAPTGPASWCRSTTCRCRAALDLPLFVLLPRRPQFNGCVERANDGTRVEFWNLYDGDFTVAAANAPLADYQHFHNDVRPH